MSQVHGPGTWATTMGLVSFRIKPISQTRPLFAFVLPFPGAQATPIVWFFGGQGYRVQGSTEASQGS